MSTPDLALQLGGPYETLLEAARWAESHDLDAFAVPDHYLGRAADPSAPAFDHLVHLAGLARETESIGLVVLVSPITFRHPAVLAKMGVTLDEMSGGRFTLGLGAGWMTEEHRLFGLPFPATGTRFDMLEEAFGYLRAHLSGSGFSGRHYHLEAFDAAPRPTTLRLAIGGTGPLRTPTLAGRFCDEYNVYAQPLDAMRERIERARASAAAEGRDPEAVLISAAAPVVAAASAEGLRRIRGRAAEILGVGLDEMDELLTRRGIPHGPGARETLAAMAEIGVQRFYVQALVDDPEGLDDLFAALR